MSVTFNWDSYAIAMLALNVALSGTVLGLRLVKWVLPRTPVPTETLVPTGTQSAVEFENPTVRDRLSSNSDLITKSSSSTKRSSTKSNKDEIV